MPATTFIAKRNRDIGTARVKIGAYDVPAARVAVAMSATIANKLTSDITVTAEIYDGANYTKIANAMPVLVGETLDLNRLVLQTGESLHVTTSTAASVDVNLSLMEKDQ